MKRELQLSDWLKEIRAASPGKRKTLQGVSTLSAAELVGRTRVTVWKWVSEGKLDVIWVNDDYGRELFHIITYASIEKVCGDMEENDYAQHKLFDLPDLLK